MKDRTRVRTASRPVPENPAERRLQKAWGAVNDARRELGAVQEGLQRIEGKTERFRRLAVESAKQEDAAAQAVGAARQRLEAAEAELEEAQNGMD